jgi:hypothetical protein
LYFCTSKASKLRAPVTTGSPLAGNSRNTITSSDSRGSMRASEAYVSIRQHTSAYVSIRRRDMRERLSQTVEGACAHLKPDVTSDVTSAPTTQSSACVSIRQHTSAYVSIRQHTSAGYLRCYLCTNNTIILQYIPTHERTAEPSNCVCVCVCARARARARPRVCKRER